MQILAMLVMSPFLVNELHALDGRSEGTAATRLNSVRKSLEASHAKPNCPIW